MGTRAQPPAKGRDVARLFDSMAETYDAFTDLWYGHLMSTIAGLVERELQRPPSLTMASALDIGCGTGLQTQILGRMGYSTVGLDISEGLIRKARQRLPSSHFVLGDAEALPFRDSLFDVANCCGSTLSFVSDYPAAIKEANRVLKRGGRLLMEVEQKWNMDVFWTLLSALAFNALGYDVSLGEYFHTMAVPIRQGVRIDYPFPMSGGETEYMKIRLFTRRELSGALEQEGLLVRKSWGIHVMTNLIPSTVLHNEQPSRMTSWAFRNLARADDALRGRWPWRSLGCSLVVLAVRTR